MMAKGKPAKAASDSVWVRPAPGERRHLPAHCLGPLRAGNARLSRRRLPAARLHPQRRATPRCACAMAARAGGAAR